jgi:hypothetical protein
VKFNEVLEFDFKKEVHDNSLEINKCTANKNKNSSITREGTRSKIDSNTKNSRKSNVKTSSTNLKQTSDKTEQQPRTVSYFFFEVKLKYFIKFHT